MTGEVGSVDQVLQVASEDAWEDAVTAVAEGLLL
jgi:hypothetical protein